MKAHEFLAATVPVDARVFVVSGAEDFLRAEVVEHIVGAFPDRAVEVRDVAPTAAGSVSAVAPILDDLRTRDLFGGERLIHLRSAEAFVKAHGAVLERFVTAGESVHPMIIEGETLLPKAGKVAPKSGFAGAVAKSGGVLVTCAELYDTPFGGGPPERSPLSTWVQQRARRHGKSMSLLHAYHLHRAVGTSLQALDGELRKLVVAIGPRPEITMADLEVLVQDVRQAPVFEVGESFASGQLSSSLDQSARMFEHGVAEVSGRTTRDSDTIALTSLRIIAARTLKLLRVRELMDRGESFDDAAGFAGLPPFGRDRARAQVERLAEPTLRRRTLAALLELERGLKSTGGVSRTLLDLFLVESLVDRTASTRSARPWRR